MPENIDLKKLGSGFQNRNINEEIKNIDINDEKFKKKANEIIDRNIEVLKRLA